MLLGASYTGRSRRTSCPRVSPSALHTGKCLSIVVSTCTPKVGEMGIGRFPGAYSPAAELESSRLVKRFCFKKDPTDGLRRLFNKHGLTLDISRSGGFFIISKEKNCQTLRYYNGMGRVQTFLQGGT